MSRISGALFLLGVHGLPKVLNYSEQLKLIEDPFHLGAHVTLLLAIFAEVLCPLLIVAGLLVRLACLPILAVLVIAKWEHKFDVKKARAYEREMLGKFDKTADQ